MINTINLNVIETLPNMIDNIGLIYITVHRQFETFVSCAGKNLGKLDRWVVLFV